MGDKSQIEWTEATWNFLIGCLKTSAGCMGCYAIRTAWRMTRNPNPKIAKKFEGVVTLDSTGKPNWTGRINFDEATLALPLRWTRPRRIFVNSLSDLFHPNVKPELIVAAFGVMMATPHHTYQILTKHPDRAARVLRDIDGIATQQGLTPREFVEEAALNYVEACHLQADMSDTWPLPNVHILTSIENQETAEERIPWLLKIPAIVRGISAEPLLGSVNIEKWLCSCPVKCSGDDTTFNCSLDGYLDWVICGGESGPDARPMHPDWPRSLRDQCIAAGVSFFFKQWGEWAPWDFDLWDANDFVPGHRFPIELRDYHHPEDVFETVYHVGKKTAGRLLDGTAWSEYPA